MTEAERVAVLRFAHQLQALQVAAAAVSPSIEDAAAIAMAAGNCGRSQALRRLGVPCAVATWARIARAEILQRGDADLLDALAAAEQQLAAGDLP